MNNGSHSGKNNADKYNAIFINGTTSIGDYIVYGYTEDKQFLVAAKPMLGISNAYVRFVTRIRGIVNPEASTKLLSTQDGELINKAFPKIDFKRMDAGRCSMVIDETVEWTNNSMLSVIDNAVEGLVKYLNNTVETTVQMDQLKIYARDCFITTADGQNGFVYDKAKEGKKGGLASVSHLSLASGKKPDTPKKTEETDDAG